MNQVAKKENAGALAVNLFEADAHAGTQNMSREDLALPFLKVLDNYLPKLIKETGNMSRVQIQA
jgi:hypothetical protein